MIFKSTANFFVNTIAVTEQGSKGKELILGYGEIDAGAAVVCSLICIFANAMLSEDAVYASC